MKASELNKAKYWLNTKLRDDGTPYGGISHSEETLKEFLEEAAEVNNRAIDEMDMHRVNNMLKNCGFKPIDYKFTNERKQFAVVIGVYFGSMSEMYFGSESEMYVDSISDVIISKIIDFADNHDFEMVVEDGEWVIDTELAGRVAWEYVKKITFASVT